MNVVNKLCQLHYTYVLYAVKHFCFFINESWLNVNVPTSCLDPESCLRMAIANWTCVSWVAYALGTIAVNVTWIEREFNACQTPRSMYPSIFNRFWDIASRIQGAGWVALIDLTNFCINVKSHLRMNQNTHHFLVKIQFFSGEGAQPLPGPLPSTVRPPL